MEINWRELAKIGYEAYAESTSNKNFRGEEMPNFDDLPQPIISAWIAATQTVCDYYGRAVIV